MPTLKDLGGDSPRDKSLSALAAMLDSLNQVMAYVDCDREVFDSDRMRQDGVMYRLLCAGEAAKRFCDAYEGADRPDGKDRLDHRNEDSTKVSLTDDQWKGIMGLRDSLSHKVDEQDLDIVWAAATEHVPLMVTPIWNALKNASIGWAEEKDSRGRIAVRRKINDEMQLLTGELLANLKAISLNQVKAAFTKATQEALAPLQSTLAEMGLNAVTDGPAAQVAENAMEQIAELEDREESIALFLQENYDEGGLENEALDKGPRPIIDEVITEEVTLEPQTGAWEAYLHASVHYEDDEGSELWTNGFRGVATGTISEDGEIEIDEILWEDDDPEEGAEWSEPW